MTLTSFDLVSDFDGSIKKTFDAVDHEFAVMQTIHELGYSLILDENENTLFNCKVVNSESGDIEHIFLSYSKEAAAIEALTELGYSIYESLTEAELDSFNKLRESNNDLDDSDSDDFEEIEDGKILAFEL